MPFPRAPTTLRAQVALVVGAYLALALPLVAWPRFQPDENYILNAGVAMLEGRVLYRDVMFPQAPLTALLFLPVTALGFPAGVYAGRVIEVATGAGMLAALVVVARRLWGGRAALLPAAFVLATVPFVLYATLVNSITPAAMCVALALVPLSAPRRTERHYALAGVLLALAAGFRLNLAVLALPLAVVAWREGRRPLGTAVVAFGATSLVVFAPFLLAAGERAWWGLVTYHVEENRTHDGLQLRPGDLVRKMWAYSYWFRGFAALLGFGVAGAWVLARARDAAAPALRFAALGGVLVLLASLATNTVQAWYPLAALPLLALAGADLVTRLARGAPGARGAAIALVVVLLALNAAAEVAATSLRSKPSEDLRRLDEAASLVAGLTEPGDEVFTFHAYVAHRAGRPLAHGMEMGTNAWYPNMPDEEAERLVVMNHDGLVRALEARAYGALVLTRDRFDDVHWPKYDYGEGRAHVSSEEAWSAVAQHYRLAHEVGEGEDAILIFVPK